MKIGITGGIGSGKSYVCQHLQTQGIEVFDCDNAAKQLMRTSAEIRRALEELIGSDAYTADGKPNKAVISRFLLASERNAKAIDAIVHPAVFEAFKASGLNALESAIIFESGAYKLVDRVVCVIAPREVRIHRVMERDHISREQVEDWMRRQQEQKTMIRLSDYVVINDGEQDIDYQLNKIIKQCNKQS